MKKYSPPPFFFLCFLISVSSLAQTSQEAKAKFLEEQRLLKQQQIEEQKIMNDCHNQDAQQEIKKQGQELQQKNIEIASSRQDAQTSKAEASRAKAELEVKQRELSQTQIKIDSAKKLLSETESMLMSSEMQNKRIQERLQFQEDSVKILRKEQEVQEAIKNNVLKASAIKDIALVVIEFISELEEFQKRLFDKELE